MNTNLLYMTISIQVETWTGVQNVIIEIMK